MASLYKRATPPQSKVLRIVEGAVKNAADAHPEFGVTLRFARSVAKRAAGTLTAQWREVLAARIMSPDRTTEGTVHLDSPLSSKDVANSERGSHLAVRVRPSPSPLQRLWLIIAVEVGAAKRAGKAERADTLVDVLKIIDAIQKEGKNGKA